MVTPLDTWFAGEAARRRFRRRWLGRAPGVLPPRDRAPRRGAPGVAAEGRGRPPLPDRRRPALRPRGRPAAAPVGARGGRDRVPAAGPPVAAAPGAPDGRAARGAPRPRPRGVLVPLPRRGPWAPWHGPAPRRRRGLGLAPARGAARGDARPAGAPRHARGPGRAPGGGGERRG